MTDTDDLPNRLHTALEGIESLRDAARDEDLLDELVLEWGFDSVADFFATRLEALLLEVDASTPPDSAAFLERLEEGHRVALLRNIERNASLTVQAGATGTVVQLPDERSDCVLVEMDDDIHDPDNVLLWAYDDLDHIAADLKVLRPTD